MFDSEKKSLLQKMLNEKISQGTPNDKKEMQFLYQNLLGKLKHLDISLWDLLNIEESKRVSYYEGIMKKSKKT